MKRTIFILMTASVILGICSLIMLIPSCHGADTWEESFDWSDNIIQVNPQDVYIYAPKQDITIYELSLIMPIFFGGSSLYVDGLPPEARRHFRKEN